MNKPDLRPRSRFHGFELDTDTCVRRRPNLGDVDVRGKLAKDEPLGRHVQHPGFTGLGRTLTDAHGRYRFTTIRPGAYPWRNHHNAWRPAHIHFSLFGRAFTQRLVTQMYFPDEPLFAQDPIFNAVPEPARGRLISRFSLETTQPEWALAYVFDIVLRGTSATPLEGPDEEDEA